VKKLNVILATPYADLTDVGESFVAAKWAEALSPLVNLTVLSLARPDRLPLAQQLPLANVVTWPEPQIFRRHERLNAMLKPGYPVFDRHLRKWLSDQLNTGQRYDIAHLLRPFAPRYASSLRHFDVPYIVGPLGGGLTTPKDFLPETAREPWFVKLRQLDRARLRYDPWLRATYRRAEIVLGVAPYMRDILRDVPISRFHTTMELGIDGLPPKVRRTPMAGHLRLLYVGRMVRTKGLLDVVRALSLLDDLPNITLTAVGVGPDLDAIKAEAVNLGVADRVIFTGQIPRHDVEDLYCSHDVFVFPSIREAAGSVLYEAMRWGLPVVTAARGGPDSIVDDTSGFRLLVTTPTAMAADIAAAVRQLNSDPERRLSMGAGARAKVERQGLWPTKAAEMVSLYESIIL
jgi:glycosyltransferase involved in cell wall biosynthesis